MLRACALGTTCMIALAFHMMLMLIVDAAKCYKLLMLLIVDDVVNC